jgi:2-polyprenyl-3-methyl-5-hydroxy-6-metoxy-1,4-benzoquinol methylase
VKSVNEHYESHLAPIYVWMSGGFDAALARGDAEIDLVCPTPSVGLVAVDLGAGFGMHAIPLARRGCSVIAIDSSQLLLEVLNSHIGLLPVRTVYDDLLSFSRHLGAKADLVLCMGDTITHLPNLQAVEKLFADVAESLKSGGMFIITFRDYTTPRAGTERFIPVRSDADRILTCFLEYAKDDVMVHDILHERIDDAWQLRISAYRKLRLSPEWVTRALRAHRLSVRVEPGLAGMIRLIATP